MKLVAADSVSPNSARMIAMIVPNTGVILDG